MCFQITTKEILEDAIDTLVDEFAREPYKHRCEHSIHCELYSMLSVHQSLQGLHRFKGDGEHSTGLLHKEWPETKYRSGKRRGNFDLAILGPQEISQHTVREFRNGLVTPDFVVELGLNYKLTHLQEDHRKLKNSHCENGYLVHLLQPHKRIPNDVRKLREWLCAEPNRVAVVVFTSSGPMIKHLKEPRLRSAEAGETMGSQQTSARSAQVLPE